MFKFIKVAAPAIVAALAAGAVPAQAAPMMHRTAPVAYHVDARQNANISRDIARLDGRIDNAYARHQITRREAILRHNQVRDLNRLHARFSRNGLDRQEVHTLKARIARVDYSLNTSIHGHDFRHVGDRR